MAFTCGFFNSENGDRKYNAEQMSAIFDGIIADGVFTTIGDHLAVSAGTGMQVLVGTGKAWFDHTWNVNDAAYPLAIAASDVTLSRIDAIVLETNHSDSVRLNKLRVVQGTVASSPVKPTLTNSEKVHQHPLAWVTVAPGVTQIAASAIENAVGTSACPFVTGIIATTAIDDLFNQWNGEFDEWFDNLKAQLSDNVVANLQRQIDARVKIADKATADDVYNGTDDSKWVTPKSLSGAVLKVGDIQASGGDLETETSGKFLRCDGRFVQKTNYPVLYDRISNKFGAGAPSMKASNSSVKIYSSKDRVPYNNYRATSPNGQKIATVCAVIDSYSTYDHCLIVADSSTGACTVRKMNFNDSGTHPGFPIAWINDTTLALLLWYSDDSDTKRHYSLYFYNANNGSLTSKEYISAPQAYNLGSGGTVVGRYGDVTKFFTLGETGGLVISITSNGTITHNSGIYGNMSVDDKTIQLILGDSVYIRNASGIKKYNVLANTSQTLTSGQMYDALMLIPSGSLSYGANYFVSSDRKTTVYIYNGMFLMCKEDALGNISHYTASVYDLFSKYAYTAGINDNGEFWYAIFGATTKYGVFNTSTGSFTDVVEINTSSSGFDLFFGNEGARGSFGNANVLFSNGYSKTAGYYYQIGALAIKYNTEDFKLPLLADNLHYIKALK